MMNEYNPPFKITNEIIDLISKIMEQIGKVHSYEALDRLPRLRKQNRIRSVFSSCAIEANSLSLNQVSDILNGKKVIGPEKDIQEVKNALDAYNEISNFDPFEIYDLKKVHEILTKCVIERPGEFRLNEEGVFAGEECIFIAPPFRLVPDLIYNLFAWMNRNKNELHPLILSSVFHYEFVFIHPFQDGNGRTARLWQTAILGKFNPIFYWIPIENYIMENQSEYYDAISKSNANGDSTVFITFILKIILQAIINIQNDISVHTNHISMYVNKLMNVMEVGVPMTSLEIMNKLNIRSKETFRKNYLNPAVESDLVEYELKDKPTSRNQRYIRK